MTAAIQSLRSRPGVSDKLKLSCPESFRLFSEGVQALMVYERIANGDALLAAEDRLETCVRKYPGDLLPTFYLGVVKSLIGYAKLDEAIQHLRAVESCGVEALRLSAKYNLAAAYIERYSTESLNIAEQLLAEVVKELSLVSRPQQGWLRKLFGKMWPGGPLETDELLFQARAVHIYVQLEQMLRLTRRSSPWQPSLSDVKQLEKNLQCFMRDFTRAGAKRIPGSDDILADYWNDMGLLEELRATCVQEDQQQREFHANEAVKFFKKALARKRNWPPAMDNLGRVYDEQLHDVQRAIELFKASANRIERNEYANYCLGKIYAKQRKYQEAVDAFAKANPIPSAKEKRAAILENNLDRPEEAKAIWAEILKQDPSNENAKAALARLPEPPPAPPEPKDGGSSLGW